MRLRWPFAWRRTVDALRAEVGLIQREREASITSLQEIIRQEERRHQAEIRERLTPLVERLAQAEVSETHERYYRFCVEVDPRCLPPALEHGDSDLEIFWMAQVAARLLEPKLREFLRCQNYIRDRKDKP